MPSSSLEIELPLETNASLLLTFPLDNVAVKMRSVLTVSFLMQI